MFVRDVHSEDRERALGSCITPRAYRVFERAAAMLSDKGLTRGLNQEMSLCVCNGFITLPPEIDSVYAIQVDSSPTLMRNEWYQFHPNGVGDEGWTPCGYSDLLGHSFCTAREPDRPVKLALRLRSAQDANKKFRVHGYLENGERTFSADADGQLQQGFYVPTVFGALRTAADIEPITKIDFISKDTFVDWCELYAVDPDTNEAISLLGKYAPDETTPQWTRIRVPAKNVVRVRYKRKDFKVRGEDDWINTDHVEAFLMACRAIVARDSNKWEEARWCEAEAERMIKERERSRRPGGISPPQVIVSATNRQSSGLHY